MRSLVEMLSGRPTVSLVIHRSQLLWRVSSIDSWFLDKAHDSAAPCRRTEIPYIIYNISSTRTLDEYTPRHTGQPTLYIAFAGQRISCPILLIMMMIIIIIEGHSLRRACLQPATNTQNSKPVPPNLKRVSDKGCVEINQSIPVSRSR